MSRVQFQLGRGFGQILCCSFVAAGLDFGAASAQEAGSFGYLVNAAHTNSEKTAPVFKPPLSKKWSVDLGGPIRYSIIANNMVFVVVSDTSDQGSQLYALNASDGSTIWRKAIGGSYYAFNILYQNGMIYDLNNDGILQAYNAGTGAPVWSIQVPDEYAFDSPMVGSGKFIYLTGGGDGGVAYSISGTTGKIQWESGMAVGGGSPAVSHNIVLVNAGCDTYGFSQQTGAVLWHDNGGCSGGGGGDTAVAGLDGFVSGFGGGSSTVIVDLTTGKLKSALGGLQLPSLSGKLAIQANSTVVATTYETGNIAWTFAPKDSFTNSPLVANGIAYAFSNSGNLYALKATTGKLLQTLQPSTGPNGSASLVGKSGLAAASGLLVVPSVSLLTAYGP